MRPVRLIFYMFLLAFLDLTVHNVQQHSYHFELTDKIENAHVYKKNCARSGNFQHKLKHRCFQLWVCQFS